MAGWKKVLDQRHPNREIDNLAIRYEQDGCVIRAIESALGLPQQATPTEIKFRLDQIDRLFSDFCATGVPPNLIEQANLITYLEWLKQGQTPLAVALRERGISSDLLQAADIKEFVAQPNTDVIVLGHLRDSGGHAAHLGINSEGKLISQSDAPGEVRIAPWLELFTVVFRPKCP